MLSGRISGMVAPVQKLEILTSKVTALNNDRKMILQPVATFRNGACKGELKESFKIILGPFTHLPLVISVTID